MSRDSDGETDPAGETDGRAGAEYDVSSDERTWGILTHAAAFVGFVVPFGNILGPLLIWAIKKDESQFIDENGKQAVNFQISWTIWLLVSGITIFFMVGLILVPIVGLAWLVLVIVAIVRASNEQVYDYPLTLDIIS